MQSKQANNPQTDEDTVGDTASQTSKSSVPATEESLFDAINAFRLSMKLQTLTFDTLLRNYSVELVKGNNIKIPTINNKVYMTCFSFYVPHRSKYSTEKYMNKWMVDPVMRNVLLSPGNFGATCIFNNPGTKDNYVAVFVSSVFTPK